MDCYVCCGFVFVEIDWSLLPVLELVFVYFAFAADLSLLFWVLLWVFVGCIGDHFHAIIV